MLELIHAEMDKMDEPDVHSAVTLVSQATGESEADLLKVYDQQYS